MEKIRITDVWFEYNETNEEIYIFIKFKGRDIPYVTATISVEAKPTTIKSGLNFPKR